MAIRWVKDGAIVLVIARSIESTSVSKFGRVQPDQSGPRNHGQSLRRDRSIQVGYKISDSVAGQTSWGAGSR